MSEPPSVNLSNCDREPIHIPGSIQPFGALVAVTADWFIAHASTNFSEFAGLDRPIAFGENLKEHFTADAMRTLREALRSITMPEVIQRLFGLDLSGSGELFDVALHMSHQLVIVEIERHDRQAHDRSLTTLRPIMASLEQIGDVTRLCQAGAQAVADLLGLSRVMVYRFRADNSGEVIAEINEPGQDSFLGLRYPATDIPVQARTLYKRNLLRIIGDVNADPVPIEPRTGLGGEPVDLSLSTLRSVSPIHLEYLRNMDVKASLSISIIVRGQLWGLFACHHLEPLVLPFSLRTAGELFAQLFGLMLEQRISEAARQLAEKGKAVHDRVMIQLADEVDLAANLPMIADAIGPLVQHDGASAFVAGQYTSRGFAPNEEEFRTIAPRLNAAAMSRVLADTELARRIPEASAFADRAAGALVIPVSRRPRDYIVLWRRPLVQTVTWAGNPEKPVEYGPNGERLTPRKSFAAWQQTVEGTCEEWSADEIGLADMLRVTLLEVLLRLSDQAHREREQSQQKQELLIAELNHRVRNILTLIRGLIGQSKSDARDIDGFADIIGGRIHALAMAHDAITRKDWNPASLKELIRTESEAYLLGKEDRVRVSGPDFLVAPAAYSVLALVIHEMMTNSAKYGSLCDQSGALDITLSEGEHGELRLAWRESGGPPVRPPSRRGFGSTIIERSIPFELKGTADLRYKLGGVEADFEIPAQHAQVSGSGPDDSGARVKARRRPNGKGDAGSKVVLLVEDNMIIAIDTEETLLSLGVSRVDVASSVAQGRDLAAATRYDLAILDYNLGSENSRPLAEELVAAGIPTVFATGYGDAIEPVDGAEAARVLKKPYSVEDLMTLLR